MRASELTGKASISEPRMMVLVVKARKCYWAKNHLSSSDLARLPSEPRMKQLVVWLKESLSQLGSESIGSSDLVN